MMNTCDFLIPFMPNPGPTYNVLKSVQGDFHQADDKFGDAGGNQCGINSLAPRDA